MFFSRSNLRPTHQLLSHGCVTITTSRQRQVEVRHGQASDAEMLAQMYRGLSARSIRMRYSAPRHALPEELIQSEMARMLGPGQQLSTTLIGTIAGDTIASAVSVAELVQLPSDQTVAELALLVRDDYQREGLGRMLSHLIHQVAVARGVRLMKFYMLAENTAMLGLLRGLGVRYSAETRRGETTVLIPIG